MSFPPRSSELLSRPHSRLVIVDMQERLMPAIPVAERVTERCRWSVKMAQTLGIPISATEQYPKGLGTTVAPLAAELPERPSKLRFSASEALPWALQTGSARERHQIVVAGIETHVCILQTTFDLLALGYRVYIPADAVGSRSKLDWRIGLERMALAGAVITTTESVLFEWCETAGTDEFKQLNRLLTGK